MKSTNRRVFSVFQVNQYIKTLMEDDFLLNGIFVEAEISNYKNHPSGHMYFTLKDERAAISAVMFKGATYDLKFKPENGMKVIAFGRVSLYEKTGQYQLYVDILEPSGLGNLYTAFEQLKAKLSSEGLFDVIHKKEIPAYCKCVAVLTSPTGAAIKDIIQIIKRRNKGIEIVVVPVTVQGSTSSEEIIAALRKVDEWGKADCIILGRGGGSLEDLNAFNDELLARAIFKCKTPIISAVGHETDFTIADFVSDLRAETPSAAAEIVSPILQNIEYTITEHANRLRNAINKCLTKNKNSFSSLANRRVFKEPLFNIYNRQIYLYSLYKRLHKDVLHKLNVGKLNMANKMNTLESASPMGILKRGYAIVSSGDKKVIKDINQLDTNEMIDLTFYNGVAKARVIEKGENNG